MNWVFFDSREADNLVIFSEVWPNVHANSEKKWKDDPEGWMWRWEASKGHLSVTLQRSKSVAVAGQVS